MKVAFQLFIPHTIPANDILRASHVPNALETIDNEAFQLIIYIVFNAFGTCMRSATFETGLSAGNNYRNLTVKSKILPVTEH